MKGECTEWLCAREEEGRIEGESILKSSNKWALAITQWNLCKSSLASTLNSSEFTIHCLKF